MRSASAASGFPAGSFSTRGPTDTSRSNRFFTPYHAVFYSGMLAVDAGFRRICRSQSHARVRLARRASTPVSARTPRHPDLHSRRHRRHALASRLRNRGRRRRAARARRIRSSAWASSSWRADRFAACSPTAPRSTLALQAPLALGLATWLLLAHFGTAYAFDPAAGRTNAPPPILPVHARLLDGARDRLLQDFDRRPDRDLPEHADRRLRALARLANPSALREC